MPRSFAALGAVLFGVGACATEPSARIVPAQFTCEGGRKLPVSFNLDAATATVRLSRKDSVTLSRTGSAASRDYASGGYRLAGMGDSITFTAPDGAKLHCIETR